MTRPDLDALSALLDKATPGPWIEKTWRDGWIAKADDDRLIVASTLRSDNTRADAALIVAAVNALPSLIARVRELEQQVQACGIRPRGKSVAPEALAVALAMRERCAVACEKMVDAEYRTGKVDHNEQGWTQACAAAVRALEP